MTETRPWKCPRCGSSNPQSSILCDECGTASALGDQGTSKSLRKIVTVLFADLKDSTRAISEVDAESAMNLLTPLLGVMASAVREHGGTVMEIRGDGIYASFGAIDLTEDHALASSRAAIDIKRRLRENAPGALPVRIGINSGEVVVLLRSDGTYSLSGSTIHLAARLEQAAEPNTVLISGHTHSAIAKHANARPRGRLSFKGFERPVETWELLGIASESRWKARSADGLSPFHGRESALSALTKVLANAQDHKGSVFCVRGEAGAGKSRLVHEALTPAVLAKCTLWEADTELAARHSPYAVGRSLVRQWLGLAEHTGRFEVAERLSDVIKQFSESLAGYETALRALLNLDLKGTTWREFDPLHRRKLLAGSFVEICRLHARLRPLIIVVDDLQWCDSESIQLLVHLSEEIISKPIALIVMTRSISENPFQYHFPSATEVTLSELSKTDARALLDALLGSDPTLAGLKDLLLELTAGMPLFLEESVRHLAAKGDLVGEPGRYRHAGLAPIAVPDSVQSIITARVSSMSEGAQAAVVSMSAIGKRFPIALVPAIMDLPEPTVRGFIDILCANHILVHSEGEEDGVCEFRHEFFREAAYAMCLKDARKELHRKTVRAAELTYDNRLTDWLGFLSHHARLGELHNEGVTYSRLAAQQALNSSSYGTALEYCERALTHLEKLPQTRENAETAIDLRLLVRVAAGGTSDFRTWLNHLELAIKQAHALGDMPRRLLATIHRTWALNFSGSAVEAIRSGEAALNLAEALRIPTSEVLARFALAQALYAHADYGRALQILEPAIDWLAAGHETEQIGTTGTTLALSLMMHANALATSGRFPEACIDVERLADLVRRTNRTYDLVSLRYCEGLLAVHRGAYEAAAAKLDEAYQSCGANGINLFLPVVGSLLGTALAELGNSERAIEVLQKGITTADSLGHTIARTASVAALATAQLRRGNCEEALRLAGEAKSAARERGHRAQEALATRILAECFIALDPSELERPVFLLREAMELGENIGALPFRLGCSRILLKVLLSHGQNARALEHLGKAIEAAQAASLEGVVSEFQSLLANVTSHH